MKLWFRLIGYFFICWFRPRFDDLLGTSRLKFRVWPSDLDLSFHMNNGRYLTLMDLGRLDFMVRTTLLQAIIRNRWTPVVSSALVRFRRELRCFQRFELETHIIDWTDDHVIFEHRFIIPDGAQAGQVAAYALIRAGIYDRKSRAYVPITDLMEITQMFPDTRPSFPEAEKFKEAEAILYSSERAKKSERLPQQD